MSNLSKTLTKLLEAHEMRPADLARASGLTEAKISRWLNGVQKFISDEDLEHVAIGLTDKPAEQAELLVARLRDQLQGPGSSLVSVSIRGDTEFIRETAPKYGFTKLPPKWEKVMNVLAEQITKDADLRNVLEGLANIYTKGHL